MYINIYLYKYLHIYLNMKSSFAKTDNNFQKLCFSLCIPINLNQTAVVLFWLGKNN